MFKPKPIIALDFTRGRYGDLEAFHEFAELMGSLFFLFLLNQNNIPLHTKSGIQEGCRLRNRVIIKISGSSKKLQS